MSKKALIAMSGGVDSSVAALLMKEKGYDCMGVTMKLYDNEDIGINKQHTCCSLDDIQDAKMVAYTLDIPHYVCNFTDDFKDKVMYKFVRTYLDGHTPNPCIDCNKNMKFSDLWKKAVELECETIVTGHYVINEYDEENDCYRLKKAADITKDQSYVLYFLTQEDLKHIQFPLGELTKNAARDIAEANNLINARKHDSQDICFVPDGDYAKIVKKYACEACPGRCLPPSEGNFVDLDGNILGKHKGIYNYTIGQRKGLGIAAKAPLYVVRIDTERNEVILGSNDDLFTREVHAADVSFVNPIPDGVKEIRCSAKIRYRHTEQPGTLTINDDGSVTMLFDEPQRAVTKGQSLVIYDGEYVLGGGTIY